MRKLEERILVTCVPPEMLTKELRVATTAATDDLTPTSGKKIRILGIYASQYIASAATTTLRASLSFGTDHVTDTTKVLVGYRQSDAYDDAGASLFNINVVGEVDEIVRLTNVTFSAGSVISRAIVYYREE